MRLINRYRRWNVLFGLLVIGLAMTAFFSGFFMLQQKPGTSLPTFRSMFAGRTAYAAELAAEPAKEIKVISTTEPALAYSFGGLTNSAVVEDVLTRLNTLGIKATFFVAETEMKRFPNTVRAIVRNGHEVGIAIRPKDGESLEETTKIILRSRLLLQEQFGVKTNLVKQLYGAVSDATKQAVANTAGTLIGQTVNVVQSRHKDYKTADQVMAEIFGKSVFSLGRGQIVHFRLDYYTHNNLAGDLLEAIKQRKIDNIAYAVSFDYPAGNPANTSQYVIKPVGQLMTNAKFVYRYPADLNQVPERLRRDGSQTVSDNFLAEASKRYIGNADVTYEDRMLGFSKIEARRLDKTGLVHTGGKVIFLTFDDWGTDASINKLLYVLRKHQVPATFFVITHNVPNNPNLLRAIALEGHSVGSHSDMHIPMAVRDLETGRQSQQQSREEYTKDLAASYQKLRSVIGDVVVNGRPALTRYFRPPTLAISRMGMESALATGFEYIISGSGSTYDYKAQTVSELVETMKGSLYTETGDVKKGTVLVMHMSDNSVYTAMALDILLTANEAKADTDPSKFIIGRLSDYLVDGYSQLDRKKSLQVEQDNRQKPQAYK